MVLWDIFVWGVLAMSQVKLAFIFEVEPRTGERPPVYPSSELICANTAYRILLAAKEFEQMHHVSVHAADLSEPSARQMLCEIAHAADLHVVLRALGAVGGPSSVEECAQRIQAAKDASASGRAQ